MRTRADSAKAPNARRQELADFLRSRRERIAPEQVGLARGARRRTPGLRREEVAQLAAVGVTWYTWLEQARDIQVSAKVLDALARALLLDPSERAHLFTLGGTADPVPEEPCTVVTPALRAMLDRLDPFPACVQNARYDILAYNRAFSLLMCDMDGLPREDRNCMWLAFTNDQWRAATGDLEDETRVMVAKFRAAMAEHVAEPAWKAMLARLQTLPEFRALWDRFEVVGVSDNTKHVDNPHVGYLKLLHSSLWLAPQSGARLVSYVPENDETRARLERLRLLAGPERAAGEAGEPAAASSEGGRAPEDDHRRPRPQPARARRHGTAPLVPAEV
ncbi:helix-turn-helix transcriptional regulator [Goodfellowiella coeruleoviolacea]|uniref:Helix-turn-helix domain-containing protein n=1 Tax=Goodfellowiella coeruleoviolacea TaxID=334858 RepID=A0AAE3GFB2_9PSEU|nr:helix-turn-helix transcriptional regulator [Goodfellowiella coeruleoviolacea]MCP2165103.1 Helix-turn-helix domain-containing protein [Goodfellowiella coeruleoviolacea]